MTTAAILVVFPFCMAYAVFSDLISMTIANRVSVILVVTFVAIAAAIGMPAADIALHLAVGAGCLVLTFAFFAFGWMGGGDAKLMAATMVWFGAGLPALDYFMTAAVYGSILSLGLICVRAQMAPVTGIGFVDHLLQPDTGVPYGIALGAAGLTVYSGSPFLDLAVRGIQ